jgi:DNA-binding response OmpR family regulator
MKQEMLKGVLILVIEDDFDIYELLRDRLNELGFAVLGTTTGEQGLALIEYQASIGCPIGGLLVNLHMSGLDGMAVLKQMREHHPKIPVIIMSSLPNGGRLGQALRLGARDYITKPFDDEEL